VFIVPLSTWAVADTSIVAVILGTCFATLLIIRITLVCKFQPTLALLGLLISREVAAGAIMDTCIVDVLIACLAALIGIFGGHLRIPFEKINLNVAI